MPKHCKKSGFRGRLVPGTLANLWYPLDRVRTWPGIPSPGLPRALATYTDPTYWTKPYGRPGEVATGVPFEHEKWVAAPVSGRRRAHARGLAGPVSAVLATSPRVKSEPVGYHPGAVQAPSRAKVWTTGCLQAPRVFGFSPESSRAPPAAERPAAPGRRRESAAGRFTAGGARPYSGARQKTRGACRHRMVPTFA